MIDTSAADDGSNDSIINDPGESALAWFSAIRGATVDIIHAARGADASAAPDASSYDAGSADLTGYGPQIPLSVAEQRGIVRTAGAPIVAGPLAAGVNLSNVSPLVLIGVLVGAFVLLRK